MLECNTCKHFTKDKLKVTFWILEYENVLLDKF